MRLAILDSGHGIGSKILFAMIAAFSGQRVVDVIKVVRYRSDFYRKPMGKVVHEAMRGASSWSVGDGELMAAFVSKANHCEFCIKAHAAVSERAYGESTKVSAAHSKSRIGTCFLRVALRRNGDRVNSGAAELQHSAAFIESLGREEPPGQRRNCLPCIVHLSK